VRLDLDRIWRETETLAGGRVRRELVLERKVVAFEPTRHHVERNGSAWVRWWQATATSPVHEERFALRPAARTEEEYIDRLFAVAEPELRQVAANAQARDRPLEQILLWASPRSEHGGAHALVFAARRSGWLEYVERYPQLKAVVDRPWPRGWLPVFVPCDTRDEVSGPTAPFAGIRWVAVRDDADPMACPDAATDYRTWSTRRAIG
jgi:hypothetical protein